MKCAWTDGHDEDITYEEGILKIQIKTTKGDIKDILVKPPKGIGKSNVYEYISNLIYKEQLEQHHQYHPHQQHNKYHLTTNNFLERLMIYSLL